MEKEVPSGVHIAGRGEINFRQEFFKNPDAKIYAYYDKDHKYIGNVSSISNGKYLFMLPSGEPTVLNDEDRIFYIRPAGAVGGRKQRTNRRKNKNRRTKSRRNRRS
jgi:hypothetical protein